MKKTLGILGGMGPQATVDLFQKIIDMTEAAKDADHMRIYIDNHPQIPERMAAILENVGNPLSALQESLSKLAACGADIIAMPCITAHYFLPGMVKSTDLQILDMIELTVKACQKQNRGKRAGLLSSLATAQTGLLREPLEMAGIKTVSPTAEQQKTLARLIVNVKAKKTAEAVDDFLEITTDMQKRGADYFVLACTELPILAKACNFSHSYIDPTTELARAAVEACGYS